MVIKCIKCGDEECKDGFCHNCNKCWNCCGKKCKSELCKNCGHDKSKHEIVTDLHQHCKWDKCNETLSVDGKNFRCTCKKFLKSGGKDD